MVTLKYVLCRPGTGFTPWSAGSSLSALRLVGDFLAQQGLLEGDFEVRNAKVPVLCANVKVVVGNVCIVVDVDVTCGSAHALKTVRWLQEVVQVRIAFAAHAECTSARYSSFVSTHRNEHALAAQRRCT